MGQFELLNLSANRKLRITRNPGRPGIAISTYTAEGSGRTYFLPAMRVVHWRAPNGDVELSVGSLAVIDDDDNSKMGINFNLLDALVPYQGPFWDSYSKGFKKVYNLRMGFHEVINEGLQDLGCPKIDADGFAMILTDDIYSMEFDRLTIMEQLEYHIGDTSVAS